MNNKKFTSDRSGFKGLPAFGGAGGDQGSEVQTFGDPRSLSPNWVEKLTALESLEDIETRQP